MTHGRHYRKGDYEYGCVCPRCAGPKHRQSGMCAVCYTDGRRRLEYPLPPVPERTARATSPRGQRGRSQPADHPWRKRWLLQAAKARAAS